MSAAASFDGSALGLSVHCDEALYVGAPVAHVCLYRRLMREARRAELADRVSGKRYGRALVRL